MRLVMEHLSKQFKNRIAVESIDTELREGVYGFLGANGAGKTTLMQMICGIIEPTAGEVKINGENNIQMGERFRDMLGYLPQEFGYTPGFTANDFMLYIASIKGLPPRFAKRKTKELLKLVNLEKDAGRKIRTFSGGMKRRLGIAQALLNDPKILILDEPTAGLDVAAREDVLDLLREYMEEKEERAILISSHISSDLEGLCDDLYMIHNGKIVLHEETDVLLGEYAVLKVDEEQYQTLDKQYILSRKKEAFGYQLLTNQKQFYLENYPKVVVENGTIDEAILMMIKGESV